MHEPWRLPAGSAASSTTREPIVDHDERGSPALSWRTEAVAGE